MIIEADHQTTAQEQSIRPIEPAGHIASPQIRSKSRFGEEIRTRQLRDDRLSTSWIIRTAILEILPNLSQDRKNIGVASTDLPSDIGFFPSRETNVPASIFAANSAAGVSEKAAFYDSCSFGNDDLRGYSVGQFRNKRMFATQVEYRRELPWRFGFVGFAGIGGVAPRFNAFKLRKLLPAAGAGIRFKLEKETHINYRVDFGLGREGYTVTLSVLEAF